MSTVRLARPDELHSMTVVAERAFAHDPAMAYISDWQQYPDRVSLDTPHSLSTLDRQHRIFYYFLDGLARGTLATKGRLVVAVVPDDAQPSKERIVAVAYWVCPGAHLDSIGTMIKAKQHRVVLGDRRSFLRGMGIKGYKRAIIQYQQPVDAIQKRECKTHGVDVRDCWHLQLICVDPEFEGKGFCGKLMREQFAFAPDAPCVLEASTPKSRDVYLHYGFQTTGEITMGAGKVGANGLPVRAKEQATGAPVFTMFRAAPKSE
ncbi:hypothetical protein AURDEDRAFT_116702 [Auricularia subglabra TFB-10046 SS5]|uniref:N-acetyltransferase domain-containing protein n=1 Tax=Auricularia subglabra (strain TFB-10046 / SS5) TaxID=717982 RepID=J0D0D8_AURST|nr:hypothetical protein AURDEDRAFT_116702 [Auricularia subglabra TFB-10046 SS5]